MNIEKRFAALYLDEIITILDSNEVMSFCDTLALSVIEAYKDGATIYLCGNGGNAGTLSHIACDLNMHPFVCENKSTFLGRKGKFNVVNLCESPSVMTAISNDVGARFIFSEQLGLAKPKDLLICLTGSGNSMNVVTAAMRAKECGVNVVGITRRGPCDIEKICDMFFCLGKNIDSKFPGQTGPNNNNFYFEDFCLMVFHMCCGILKSFVEGQTDATQSG